MVFSTNNVCNIHQGVINSNSEVERGCAVRPHDYKISRQAHIKLTVASNQIVEYN